MQSDDPPYLVVGTEVSAKFKGAFCEAKIKKIDRAVRCKILLKEHPFGQITAEDSVIKGHLAVNELVEVQQNKSFLKGVIQHIKDCSTYIVVFNDGDEKNLRRTQICLKGGKHYTPGDSLDSNPLYNPENVGSLSVAGQQMLKTRNSEHFRPVVAESSDEEEIPPPPVRTPGRRGRPPKDPNRVSEEKKKKAVALVTTTPTEAEGEGMKKRAKRRLVKEEESDESSDDERPRKEAKKEERQVEEITERPEPTTVVCAWDDIRGKGKWSPVVTISMRAYKQATKNPRLLNKNECPVKLFLNGKVQVQQLTSLSPFDAKIYKQRIEEPLSVPMKAAMERANNYLTKKGLPKDWDESMITGEEKKEKKSDEQPEKKKEKKVKTEESSSSESSGEEVPAEEKDLFVAQLYKFQEERGTPINRAPILGGKDIDLYRFHKVVQKYGGMKRVTDQNKWKKVLVRMKLEGCSGATPITVKKAYLRYLSHFSQFYKRLGYMNVDALSSTATAERSSRNIRLADKQFAVKKKEEEKDKKKEEKKAKKEKESSVSTVEEGAPPKKDKEEKEKPKEDKKEEKKDVPKIGRPRRESESGSTERHASGSPVRGITVPLKKESIVKKEDKEMKKIAEKKIRKDDLTFSMTTSKKEDDDRTPTPAGVLSKEDRNSTSDDEGKRRMKIRSGRESTSTATDPFAFVDSPTSEQIDVDSGYVSANLLTHFFLGQKVRALHVGRWYDARVVEVKMPPLAELFASLGPEEEDGGVTTAYKEALKGKLNEAKVYVHYLGWNARYDEWLTLNKLRVSEKDDKQAQSLVQKAVDEGKTTKKRAAWIIQWSNGPDGTHSLRSEADEASVSSVLALGSYRPRRISMSAFEGHHPSAISDIPESDKKAQLKNYTIPKKTYENEDAKFEPAKAPVVGATAGSPSPRPIGVSRESPKRGRPPILKESTPTTNTTVSIEFNRPIVVANVEGTFPIRAVVTAKTSTDSIPTPPKEVKKSPTQLKQEPQKGKRLKIETDEEEREPKKKSKEEQVDLDEHPARRDQHRSSRSQGSRSYPDLDDASHWFWTKTGVVDWSNCDEDARAESTFSTKAKQKSRKRQSRNMSNMVIEKKYVRSSAGKREMVERDGSEESSTDEELLAHRDTFTAAKNRVMRQMEAEGSITSYDKLGLPPMESLLVGDTEQIIKNIEQRMNDLRDIYHAKRQEIAKLEKRWKYTHEKKRERDRAARKKEAAEKAAAAASTTESELVAQDVA